MLLYQKRLKKESRTNKRKVFIYPPLLLLFIAFFIGNPSTLWAGGSGSGGGGGTPQLCSDAKPFCSSQTYNFPNVSTGASAPSGPDYAFCSNLNPIINPVWYYMKVDNGGKIKIKISQSTGQNGSGSSLDVDFVMWGPYNSLSNACQGIENGDHPIQRSWAPDGTETAGIGVQGGSNYWCNSPYGQTTPPPAQPGDIYVFMITNADGSSGYISFNQTNTNDPGAGSSDCNIVQPCTPPNIVVNGLGGCNITSVDLNDAIDPSSDPATITFYNSQTDAQSANNPINNMVTTSGTYWLRAENTADTCHTVKKITVSLGSMTYTATVTPTSCGNSIGEIVLNPTGGTAPYTYSIDGGTTFQGSNTFSNLGGGSYSIIIKDAGGSCQVTGTENISSSGSPTITSLTATDPSCQGSKDGTATVTISGGTPPYDYVWTNASNTTVSSSPASPNTSDKVNNLGPDSYTVSITDKTGCITSDVVIVNKGDSIAPTFSADILSGCSPLTVQFSKGGAINNPSKCEWDFGDGTTIQDCSSTVQHVYTNEGTYSVNLTVTSASGCSGTVKKQDYIQVLPGVTANFTATPMVVSSSNTEVDFTNKSEGATDYIWTFGDFSGAKTNKNVSHSYPTEGGKQYIVQLIASNGDAKCNDTARIIIQVNDELVFYVPNTFTPDKDHFNEVFQPVFSSGYDPQEYTLEIYNRWGETLFISHNTEIGWDGTYNNKIVKDGTYIWKITVKETMTDTHHIFNGFVTLVR